MLKIKILPITTIVMLLAVSAQAYETKARNAILIDYDTGAYLYAKDAQKMVPPASMSKLMTAYLIFEQIKTGKLLKLQKTC